MSDPVKQHTLPRFYITGFQPGPKLSKNPELHYYPLSEPPPRAWRVVRAKKISTRSNIYTLPDSDPAGPFAIERFLADMESDVAPDLRRLARGERAMLGGLSLFVATMAVRSTTMIEGFANFASGFLSPPLTLAESVRTNFSAMIEDLAPRLMGMTWNVLLTDHENPLITSDQPVELGLPLRGSRVEDLDHAGFGLSMPLTKDAAVIINKPRSGPLIQARQLVPGGARELNVTLIKRAANFLIAPSSSFPGVEALDR